MQIHYTQRTGNADWDTNINDLLYNNLHDHHTALYSSSRSTTQFTITYTITETNALLI